MKPSKIHYEPRQSAYTLGLTNPKQSKKNYKYQTPINNQKQLDRNARSTQHQRTFNTPFLVQYNQIDCACFDTSPKFNRKIFKSSEKCFSLQEQQQINSQLFSQSKLQKAHQEQRTHRDVLLTEYQTKKKKKSLRKQTSVNKNSINSQRGSHRENRSSTNQPNSKQYKPIDCFDAFQVSNMKNKTQGRSSKIIIEDTNPSQEVTNSNYKVNRHYKRNSDIRQAYQIKYDVQKLTHKYSQGQERKSVKRMSFLQNPINSQDQSSQNYRSSKRVALEQNFVYPLKNQNKIYKGKKQNFNDNQSPEKQKNVSYQIQIKGEQKIYDLYKTNLQQRKSSGSTPSSKIILEKPFYINGRPVQPLEIQLILQFNDYRSNNQTSNKQEGGLINSSPFISHRKRQSLLQESSSSRNPKYNFESPENIKRTSFVHNKDRDNARYSETPAQRQKSNQQFQKQLDQQLLRDLQQYQRSQQKLSQIQQKQHQDLQLQSINKNHGLLNQVDEQEKFIQPKQFQDTQVNIQKHQQIQSKYNNMADSCPVSPFLYKKGKSRQQNQMGKLRLNNRSRKQSVKEDGGTYKLVSSSSIQQFNNQNSRKNLMFPKEIQSQNDDASSEQSVFIGHGWGNNSNRNNSSNSSNIQDQNQSSKQLSSQMGQMDQMDQMCMRNSKKIISKLGIDKQSNCRQTENNKKQPLMLSSISTPIQSPLQCIKTETMITRQSNIKNSQTRTTIFQSNSHLFYNPSIKSIQKQTRPYQKDIRFDNLHAIAHNSYISNKGDRGEPKIFPMLSQKKF